MRYNIEQLLNQAVGVLKNGGEVPSDWLCEAKVDRTKDLEHGDYATNLAFVLAKPCGKAPRQMAEALVRVFPSDPRIERVERAGAGFINFFLSANIRFEVVADVLRQQKEFGRCHLGQGQKVLVEFVSVNAMEPLPVGHGRSVAKSESSDNPVYCIQYAHARICSVLRQLTESGFSWDSALGLNHLVLLEQSHEEALIALLSRYPDVIQNAARLCESHQLVYYLRELANGLHSYYNAVQLLCDTESLRCARMCLLEAIRIVLNNGLELLGVSAPESM